MIASKRKRLLYMKTSKQFTEMHYFTELVLVGHNHKSFVFRHTHKAKQNLKENKIT